MPVPHMNSSFPQSLPPELITEIISLCPKSSVSILCRVSRLIYDISFPILYRHLELRKSSLFIECSRTLLASNVASKSVRWLIISFEWVSTKHFLPCVYLVYQHYFSHATLLSAFYQVLGKVLPRLSRLSILRISVAIPNAAYFTVLSNCHFPHLLIFEIISQRRSMTTKNFLELHAFLHRHSSTITALSLDVPASKTLSTGKLPMHFPSLSKFIGNIALVPYLFQKQCSLRSMHFLSTRMFRIDDEQIDNLFEHVQRVAGNTLEHVELLAQSFTGSQPRILARHLPNIKVLMLAHLSYAESNGVSYFDHCIPNLAWLSRSSTGSILPEIVLFSCEESLAFLSTTSMSCNSSRFTCPRWSKSDPVPSGKSQIDKGIWFNMS